MTIPTRLTSRSLFAFIVLLAACDPLAQRPALDSMSVTSAAEAPPALNDMSRQSVMLGVAGGVAKAERMAPQQTRPVAAPAPASTTGMIIRNGFVNMQVDSIEIATERLRQLTVSLGGFLGNVSIQTGANQVRSATLEMKIPAARFDSAMLGMPALGKVEQSSATAEDVGEEFVDITARVANAKRLESRLVSLLATRTAKLSDVLAVERELARVREEIERHEGRIRFLSTRVATSTINVTVHEKVPIIAGPPGNNVFVAAFKNMWRNFVRFLANGIELLGVLVPVTAIAWAGYAGWRRWRRSRIPAAA